MSKPIDQHATSWPNGTTLVFPNNATPRTLGGTIGGDGAVILLGQSRLQRVAVRRQRSTWLRSRGGVVVDVATRSPTGWGPAKRVAFPAAPMERNLAGWSHDLRP